MSTMNMNSLRAVLEEGPEPDIVAGAVSDDGNVEVVLRNLPNALIGLMRQYEAAVGCVAWLTHFDILDAMARLKSVAVIVQKEDFLRPDIGQWSDWKNTLRRKYNALSGIERYGYGKCIVPGLSYCGDPSLDGVRCVGNHNTDKDPAFPRAHHKFLVLGDLEPRGEGYEDLFIPRAVWTGSFNFTLNANRSFENAVILHDPKIVDAFYQEWAHLMSLSEPLDWTSDWVAPEFRIGS